MPNTRLHLDSKKRRSSFLYFLLSVMQGFKAVLLDKNRIAMPTRSAELALHTGGVEPGLALPHCFINIGHESVEGLIDNDNNALSIHFCISTFC